MMDFSQMYSLFTTGRTALENGQFRRASELYEQAYSLAECADDDLIGGKYVAIFRRNAASSFQATSRLREALAVLTPLKRNTKIPSCCVYGNMTDHFSIALELPISLSTIEKSYGEAESYFQTSGGFSWKSRILNMKAELLLARGLLVEAQHVAQEGWTRRDDDCPNHYATTHLSTLVRIDIARRDAAGAGRYLAIWEKQDESSQLMKRVEFATLQSRTARLAGDLGGALDYARGAVIFAEMVDWGEARYAAHCALARVFIVSGEHARARELLRRAGGMRRSESGHERYTLQLLRGDYHLARARAAVGASAIDDEFVEDLPRPFAHAADNVERAQALRKARAAYRSASDVGCWIDRQLECSARGAEVSARLARADAFDAPLETS